MYKKYYNRSKYLKLIKKEGINIKKCQSCGKETEGKDRHVHHIDRNRNNNNLNNLLILCALCHIQEHKTMTTNKKLIIREYNRRHYKERYKTDKLFNKKQKIRRMLYYKIHKEKRKEYRRKYYKNTKLNAIILKNIELFFNNLED